MSAEKEARASIWNRDLLDNPGGRALTRFILPPLIVVAGLLLILAGMDRVIHSFGPDASMVILGIFFSSCGGLMVVGHTFRASSVKWRARQKKAVTITGYSILASIVALFGYLIVTIVSTIIRR